MPCRKTTSLTTVTAPIPRRPVPHCRGRDKLRGVMKAEAEPATPSASTLRFALVDYFDAPGKYQLRLRQPALLFSSIREILQIASGRGAAEHRGADDERLLQAANFFIRAALLYPGADHYAVLGLRSSEKAA